MAILTLEDLPNIRKKYKNEKIVFCSGTFDLTHAGHILFFEDCKKLGDVLIVGVGGDKITKKRKGDERPIFNENIRIKTVDSFKPADYTIIDNLSSEENKLFFLNAIFEKLHPDIYAINEEAFDIPYRESLCKKFGIKLEILNRACPEEFDEISTSNIINKIKKLRD